MQGSMIKKELIVHNLEVTNRNELLFKMADLLRKGGYVKNTYLENLLIREEKYPTGLDTGRIKVAIPHTDSEYVKKAAICVAILAKAIKFKNMSEPKDDVMVNIVFMLAVKNPKEQVPTLTKLTSIFSDEDKLDELYKAKDKDEVYKILKKQINI